MGLVGRLPPAVSTALGVASAPVRAVAGGPRRHVWTGGERSHVELRPVPPEALESFSDDLVRALLVVTGAQWAQVLAPLRRVVVAHGQDTRVDDVLVVVSEVERLHGLGDAPLPADAAGHPADVDPVLAGAAALGADLVAAAAGTAGRLGRLLPLPGAAPFAVASSLIESAPAVRRLLAERLGPHTAEAGLGVVNALVQGLTQGPVGPLVDAANRSGLVAETVARRRAWAQREPELCAKPVDDRPAVGVEEVPAGRPVPLPDGPVEVCTRRLGRASLAATGVSVALPQRLERASAALYASLPKAAQMAREAFASQLGRALAARGVVTLDPAALRRLDRVDTLIVDGAVLVGDEALAQGEHLLDVARRAGLSALVATTDAGVAEGVGADAAVPAGAGLPGAVRALQADGRVVCLVGGGATPGLAAADCGVGLLRPLEPVPWGADLVGAETLDDAVLVVDGCAAAAEVSRQGALVASVGAGIAGFFTFGRVPGATGRVMLSVNAAAVAGLLNGTRVGMELARRPRPTPRDPTPWHALEGDQVLGRLDSSSEGLGGREVARRRVPPPGQASVPTRLGRAAFEELANPLTPLLVGGAGLSLAVGSVSDAAMVGGVVVLNGLIGGIQRFRTGQAMAALDQGPSGRVRVRRDGAEATIDVDALVPGDVVRFEAGDAVPADCRILEATALEVDESNLTGESTTVVKSAEPSKAAAIADRTSMLYEGTSVAAGKATGVVVAVGSATEARRAVEATRHEQPQTGVEARLTSLTSMTAPVALISGAGAIGAGILRGRPVNELVGSGVSLAVASVPEGLPLLSTLAQVAAARRLAGRGAVVSDPRAIEALGRVDVLCADKTGTLTEGRIRLGCVSDGQRDEDIAELGPRGRRALGVAVRATPPPAAGRRLPHPTDQALVEGAATAGVRHDQGAPGWVRGDELPFEPARGFHATLGRDRTGPLLSVKGAPEVVLPRCSHRTGPRGGRNKLYAAARRALPREVDRLARRGLRVLAVAERRPGARAGLDETLVDDLGFVGFVAYSDPVRPTASAAIDDLRRAGVDVVMITGDHPSTAEGIAAELGLLNGHAVITGPQLDELDDAELEAAAPTTSVYARVTPEHKVRIVRALQRTGRVVAMAGDGANDAPAIRLADVGVALGKRATPAARDAADVTVVEERIETVVDAIEEGRGMWVSVRDAVAILVGGNLGEIGFTVGASLLSGRPALNPRQLLLVNLLTDIAPAMAIALRPPATGSGENLLEEGPEKSLGDALTRAIVWRAVVTGTGTGAGWMAARMTGTPTRARTVALVTLVGTQLGQTLASGGRSPTVLAAGVGSAAALAGIVQTPGLSHAFGCRPLGPAGWITAATAAGTATAASLVLQPAFDAAMTRYGPGVARVVAPHLERVLPGRLDAPTAGDHKTASVPPRGSR